MLKGTISTTPFKPWNVVDAQCYLLVVLYGLYFETVILFCTLLGFGFIGILYSCSKLGEGFQLTFQWVGQNVCRKSVMRKKYFLPLLATLCKLLFVWLTFFSNLSLWRRTRALPVNFKFLSLSVPGHCLKKHWHQSRITARHFIFLKKQCWFSSVFVVLFSFSFHYKCTWRNFRGKKVEGAETICIVIGTF